MKRIPFKMILQVALIATLAIASARKFGQWRKDRIDAGQGDPMPWAAKLPGGTATVWAGVLAVGTSVLLKGKNRTAGYLAAGVALLPAGEALLKQGMGNITSDHRAPSSAALLEAGNAYTAAARNLAGVDTSAGAALLS